MTGYIILSAATLFATFIFFLIISRTMNNTINLLIKLEYLFQKEYDLKKEALEVRRIMEEQLEMQQDTN